MKNFGFGCMRFPMIENEVDTAQVSEMVDEFMKAGFTYFDTAHGYIDGKSETALKTCLTSRYPRESYVLTDKLSEWFFNTEEEIRPLFQAQLDACGVEYFDYYLMHTQGRRNYQKFKDTHAYEIALELKKEGKIKHFGISFHDTAAFLDTILSENPEIEVVQLQLNYLDWKDMNVQSENCLELCRKYGKKVIVMEPVKGGNLANLPPDACRIFDELNKYNFRSFSYAGYALRFAASQDDVFMVLSGMSTIGQMKDNISVMSDFEPFHEDEYRAVADVCSVFNANNLIQCTACRYCVPGCPQSIQIPDIFSCFNTKKTFGGWNANFYYGLATDGRGRASDCIKCGACETTCPQHLNIRELLEQVADVFDKKKK